MSGRASEPCALRKSSRQRPPGPDPEARSPRRQLVLDDLWLTASGAEQRIDASTNDESHFFEARLDLVSSRAHDRAIACAACPEPTTRSASSSHIRAGLRPHRRPPPAWSQEGCWPRARRSGIQHPAVSAASTRSAGLASGSAENARAVSRHCTRSDRPSGEKSHRGKTSEGNATPPRRPSEREHPGQRNALRSSVTDTTRSRWETMSRRYSTDDFPGPRRRFRRTSGRALRRLGVHPHARARHRVVGASNLRSRRSSDATRSRARTWSTAPGGRLGKLTDRGARLGGAAPAGLPLAPAQRSVKAKSVGRALS